MFDNVEDLFAPAPSQPPVTVELLWNDREAMEIWLKDTLFVEVLKLDWNGRKRRIDVAPLRLPFNDTHLLAIDLLSLLSHRPAVATVTAQDFYRAFCGAFVDLVAMPERLDDGRYTEIGARIKSDSPNPHGSVNREEPQDFLRWLSRAMLRCAHGPNGENRASLTPGLLSELLVHEAAEDPVIREKWLSAGVETIPLIVSTLFALHRQALWPVLREALEYRRLSKLKFHFSIMELFINRWAGEELRYRSVEEQDVRSVFDARTSLVYQDPRLDAGFDDVLCSLEIVTGRSAVTPTQSRLSEPERELADAASAERSATVASSSRAPDMTTFCLEVEELSEDA